jgi:hypothetical protein
MAKRKAPKKTTKKKKKKKRLTSSAKTRKPDPNWTYWGNLKKIWADPVEKQWLVNEYKALGKMVALQGGVALGAYGAKQLYDRKRRRGRKK